MSQNSSTLNLGHAQVMLVPAVTPLVSSGPNNITVTAVAGTSISSFQDLPGQNLDATSIAYWDSNLIFLYSNGATSPINSLADVAFPPTFTHDGRVAFSAFDPATNTLQIFTTKYDGTSLTKITNTTHYPYFISWSSNNSKIAYEAVTVPSVISQGIYTANTNGSGETLLVSGASEPNYPAISPDCTQVAYAAQSGGVYQIFRIPIGGGTPTLVSVNDTSKNCYFPAWSPDGKWIAYSATDNTVQYIEVQNLAESYLSSRLLQASPSTMFDNCPSFSPDGKYIAFTRGSMVNGAGSVYTAGFTGQNPTLLVPQDVQSAAMGETCWSPFPKNQTFVGTGGTLGTTANGFLWAQTGDVFASLVAFAGASSTVAAEDGSNLVFDIHSTSITSLTYTNAYYGAVVKLTPNVSDAVVTFNSGTAQVSTVAPFVVARGAVRPSNRVRGGNRVYRAAFTGIWNAQGTNLAPNGASELVLDPKSGKLVNFR